MTSSEDGRSADAFGGVVQRLAELLTSLPDELVSSYSGWIWEVDPNFVFTYASARGVELLGRPLTQILGRTPFDFMPMDEAQRARAAFARLLKAQKPFSGQIVRYQRPGGAIAVVETSGMPLFHPDGSFKGLRCTDRDVQPSGRSIDGRLAQLEAIFAATPIAQGLVDRHGRFLALNEALAAVCGQTVAQVIHQRVARFMPPAAEHFALDLARFEQGEAVAHHEIAWQERFYLVSTKPVRDRRRQVTGLMVAMTDITERKRAENKLAEANRRLRAYATYDHLTGIANRRFFDAMLVGEIRRAQRDGEPLSLVLFDVDHFKRYNDRYGHPAGDVCLQKVAQAASEALVRPTDSVYRYGGEEFAMLLPQTSARDAMVSAERVCAAVRELAIAHEDGAGGRVSVSLGVGCLWPAVDLVPLDEARAALLARADKALYAAKSAGRDRAVMFDARSTRAG